MAECVTVRTSSSRWLTPGDPEAIATALASQFAEEFGRNASGVWFAPGRVNLNGEHIDFHGGRCLPFALAHGTFAAAAARDDGVLRIRTLDSGLDTGVVSVSADRLADAPDWTRYVWGVLWAMRQLREGGSEQDRDMAVGESFGAEVLIWSSLPIGAGLSSSASLECAAALAFTALGTSLGQDHPGAALDAGLTDAHRAVLAQACIRAEVEVVGAGTGGLDQTTSLRARESQLLSLDCRDFSVRRMDCADFLDEHCLIAVDTGQPHALVISEFGDRRGESEAAAAVLGVTQLRDALSEDPQAEDVQRALERFDAAADAGAPALEGFDVAACRRRLRHALTEMVRSERIADLVADSGAGVERAAAEVGELMVAGHQSMRDDAEVSFPLADRVVAAVMEAGALGARLIGGGFGGSVLVLASRNDAPRIATAATDLSEGISLLEVYPAPAARVVLG